MSIHFITNEELYKQAVEPVAKAASFVWIGTADIKDLHVHHKGSVKSFLSVLDSLGMKSDNTRNFESGFVTTDPQLVEAIMGQFDEVWMGKYCQNCKRKDFCADPII